jgi:hypothetical protein
MVSRGKGVDLMFIELKNPNGKFFINPDHIVCFSDGQKEGFEGVYISMVDDTPGCDIRHFTEFTFGENTTLNSLRLMEKINEVKRRSRFDGRP